MAGYAELNAQSAPPPKSHTASRTEPVPGFDGCSQSVARSVELVLRSRGCWDAGSGLLVVMGVGAWRCPCSWLHCAVADSPVAPSTERHSNVEEEASSYVLKRC
ncbi:unnamed protein product [Pleuronectes platessa]|uniref:Uncharacterized protein n=1 Tax=Pleuronectes platessa TaxID=8262 RepID=A0A9N7UXX8_PLEPL|nr:unnamed protein product [Pleuronectes platessa]